LLIHIARIKLCCSPASTMQIISLSKLFYPLKKKIIKKNSFFLKFGCSVQISLMITSLNCHDSFWSFNDGSLRYLDVSHVERLDGFNAPYIGY
jgi:hypothetical protein